MIKITFVCTGNTCRSAMAECIFKQILKDNSIEGVKVSSAGLSVSETKMNEFARKALNKIGIKPRRFLPKQLTAKAACANDAIICMTEAQKSEFVGFDNVYSIDELTGLGDVPDPYGRGEEAYEAAARTIYGACLKIFELLEEVMK